MSPQTRTEVRELLERHGRHPVKALGQHFLADPNIVRKVVETAHVGPGDRVLEIGAGTGTLTAALAETGAHVLSYEVDEGLRPILEETLEGTGVDLRFRDVMDEHLSDVLGEGPWKLVANLPYSVGTPLVLDVMRRVPVVRHLTVMVQREVADRLVAKPGTDAYGLPTVIVRLNGSPRIAFTVPPQVFLPAPQVGSAVVVIDRIEPHPRAERAIELAAAAFGRRRKMLRRSLDTAVSDPQALLADAGIDGTRRGEELSPDDFLRLAEVARD